METPTQILSKIRQLKSQIRGLKVQDSNWMRTYINDAVDKIEMLSDSTNNENISEAKRKALYDIKYRLGKTWLFDSGFSPTQKEHNAVAQDFISTLDSFIEAVSPLID